MAVAIAWISASHEPSATAAGVQEVLNEYQSTAPWVVWQFTASAGGTAPAEVKTRRMPSGPRLRRSLRKPAQVFPLPTVSLTDVVAPTVRAGQAACAAGGAGRRRVRAIRAIRATRRRDIGPPRILFVFAKVRKRIY